MIKKILLCLILTSALVIPSKSLAQEKIEPPNLVETRIDGQFVDKTKVSISQDQALVLQGTAQSDSEVYLYIFSETEPLLAQVKVNGEGSWLYDLTQALPAGQHRIEGETHAGSSISAKVELLNFKVTQAEGVIPGVSNWIAILGIILILVFGFVIIWYLLKIKSFKGGKK